MTLAIDVKNRNVMSMAVPRDDIEITNFRNYVVKIEDHEIRSKTSQDKKLMLKIGTDGVLHVELIGSGKKPVEDYSSIYATLPAGYKECLRTEASKTIRGVTGKYLYFKNKDSDYLVYAVGPSNKAYRINLGKITDRESKLRQVLDKIPNVPFYKAYFNDKLPSSIVENRQPIKAALDILELEGYVKRTGKKIGISQEYIRTQKIPPKVISQIKLVEDNDVTKRDGR